jgi:DNA (cytosine-5)-methyltransferase 1
MKVISLFSGIGGFEIAAEAMGWEIAVSCEINDFGHRVLSHYWPNAYHHRDVRTLTKDIIYEKTRIKPSDEIILVGGFPCQPYSQAGRRLGKNDSRHLWPEMYRIIQEVKPRWVVGENVLGIINWSEGLVFEETHVDLENAGYEVQAFVLPAVGVGAPHRRDRVWFVARYISDANDDGHFTSEERSGMEQRDDRDSARAINAKQSEGRSVQDRVAPDSYVDTERSPRQGGEAESDRSNADAEQGSGRPSSEQHNRLLGFSRPSPNASVESFGSLSNVRRDTGLDTESRPKARGINRGGSTIHDADANSERLEGGEKLGSAGSSGEERKEQFARLLRSTWAEFPVEPPLRERNDGVSDRLVGITVSKHRNESIKALGNAIVPKVAFQIFKTIEECRRSCQ